MNIYHTFKYKEEFNSITDTQVFDSYIDNTLDFNQQILSIIYLCIEDGKIEGAIQLFMLHIK
jgi:hypothetical protein